MQIKRGALLKPHSVAKQYKIHFDMVFPVGQSKTEGDLYQNWYGFVTLKKEGYAPHCVKHKGHTT